MTYDDDMTEQRRKGASFVPTSDDWCPNYPGDLVAVTLREYQGTWTVSVWGADNLGMCRRFTDEAAARRCRQELPAVLSFQNLRDLGFRQP